MQKNSIRHRPRWLELIPNWLAATATLLTLGSVGLHAIGTIYHNTYLAEMGVPSDLFPKSIEWVLMSAYDVLAGRWLLLFKYVFAHPVKFIAICILAIFLCLIYWAVLKWQPPPTNVLSKMPRTMKSVVRTLSLSVVISAILPAAIFAVMFLLIIVYAPGQYAAKERADADKKKFQVGCNAPNGCVTLWRGGKPIATGLLFESSESRLALYDPVLRQIRVVPMDGLEITAPLPAARQE